MYNFAIECRPTTFKDVVGNEDVVNRIQQHIGVKAMLFHGTTGIGKTTMATIVARQLAEDYNIIRINAASDLGKEGSITSDLKQRIIDWQQLVRQRKDTTLLLNRVVIIDEIHALNALASQALLSSLESEEYPHLFYIFCTTNVQKVIKTILNRCLCFELKPATTGDIEEVLCRVLQRFNIQFETVTVSDIAAKVAAQSGSIREALTVTESLIVDGKLPSYVNVEDALILDEDSSPKDAIGILAFMLVYGVKDGVPGTKHNGGWLQIPRVSEVLSRLTEIYETKGDSGLTTLKLITINMIKKLFNPSVDKQSKTWTKVQQNNKEVIDGMIKAMLVMERSTSYVEMMSNLNTWLSSNNRR